MLCYRGWRYGGRDGKDDESMDLRKQAHIATLAIAAPAVTGKAPTAGNGPPAVAESALIPLVKAPQLGRDHASITAWQRGGRGGGGSAASAAAAATAAAAAVRRQRGSSTAAAWRQWVWRRPAW